MDITVTSTTKLVNVNGVPARLWEGVSEKGVPVFALITRIAVPANTGPQDLKQFEAELQHHQAPSIDLPGALRIGRDRTLPDEASDGYGAHTV